MPEACYSFHGVLLLSSLLILPWPDSSAEEASGSFVSPSPAVFCLACKALFMWHGFEVSVGSEADCDLERPPVGDFCLCKVSNEDIALP